MAEQLTFNLPVRTALGRADFFVSVANARALQRLDAPEDWQNGKLALIGPKGAGKTHLAHVWVEAQRGTVIDAKALDRFDIAATNCPVAVDHIDSAPLSDEAEIALFHLHNHLAQSGLPLLLIGRAAPARWELTLPDIRSRAAGTDVVAIEQPDDRLLEAMFIKLFSDRQLKVAPAVIPYLVTRTERSFASVTALVTALDTAALREKRSITQPLARAVLDKMVAGEA